MTDMEMIFMGTPRQTDHSPTPWELVEATEHHGPYICNVYGGDVCDLYAMSNPLLPSTASGGTSRPVPFVDADANAAFIVKAVNSHERMFEALMEIGRIANEPGDRRALVDKIYGIATEACRIPSVVFEGKQP